MVIVPSSTLSRNARLAVRGTRPAWLRPAAQESAIRSHFPIREATPLTLYRVDGAGNEIADSEFTVVVPSGAQAGFFRTKEKSAANQSASRKGTGDERAFCADKYIGAVAFYVANVNIMVRSSVARGQLTFDGVKITVTEYRVTGYRV